MNADPANWVIDCTIDGSDFELDGFRDDYGKPSWEDRDVGLFYLDGNMIYYHSKADFEGIENITVNWIDKF